MVDWWREDGCRQLREERGHGKEVPATGRPPVNTIKILLGWNFFELGT